MTPFFNSIMGSKCVRCSILQIRAASLCENKRSTSSWFEIWISILYYMSSFLLASTIVCSERISTLKKKLKTCRCRKNDHSSHLWLFLQFLSVVILIAYNEMCCPIIFANQVHMSRISYLFRWGAGGGIWTHGPLRDEVSPPHGSERRANGLTPLAMLGNPRFWFSIELTEIYILSIQFLIS